VESRIDPARKRLSIPLPRALGLPGGLEWDLLRQLVQHQHPQPHAGEREEADAAKGDGALKPVDLATLADKEVVALVIRLVDADAQFLGKRVDTILARPEPGTTKVLFRPVLQVLRPDAAADPVTGLEHGHGPSGLCEAAGSRQPGKAGANYTELGLQMLHHPAPSFRFPQQGDLSHRHDANYRNPTYDPNALFISLGSKLSPRGFRGELSSIQRAAKKVNSRKTYIQQDPE
jgi:hypothetical protein